MDFVTLNNGIKMPLIGFGTYQMPSRITERFVLTKLYRLAIVTLIRLNVMAMSAKLDALLKIPVLIVKKFL